jgi:hypothetical protein
VTRAGSLDGEPSHIVDRCLDVMGAIQVSEPTYKALVSYTKELKGMQNDGGQETAGIHNLLQMIASTVDYQFA